jgi:hypothetical protein
MATFEQAGWFSEYGKNALRDYADRVRHLTGAVVEVGCWEGNSTIALANAVFPETLHCIDHWQGVVGGGEEMTKDILCKRNVFGDFLANMDELTHRNYEVHKADWRTVFLTWAEPIKLLHIDGSHTYEEVRDNIIAALPHLVSGGIIAFDDSGYGPVSDAIRDTLGELPYNGLAYYIKP